MSNTDILAQLRLLLNKVNGDPCDASEFVALVQGTIEALEDGGGGATIEIVDVVTIEPGEEARVENTGTDQALKLVFYIPKGADGQNGAKGETGETGPAGPQGIQGKSAFDVWKETTGRTTANEAEYIADLQTKVAKWIPVAYEATAASASIGNTVTFTTAPSNPIDGAIVIMPKAQSSATETMMFAVSEDPNTQGVYIYTYIGDLNVDTTGLLGIGDVDGTGLANPAPNAIAKARDVMRLSEAVMDEVDVEMTNPDYLLRGWSINSSTGYWATASALRSYVVPVKDAQRLRIEKSGEYLRFAFLRSLPEFSDDLASTHADLITAKFGTRNANMFYCGGTLYPSLQEGAIPEGCSYIWITKIQSTGDIDRTPDSVTIWKYKQLVTDGGLPDKVSDIVLSENVIALNAARFIPGLISSETLNWEGFGSSLFNSIVVPVISGQVYTMEKEGLSRYAFLMSLPDGDDWQGVHADVIAVDGASYFYCGSTSSNPANRSPKKFVIPEGCKYLWVSRSNNGVDSLPDRLSYKLLSFKQDTLVSGINIKTINGNSLLGFGDINIDGIGTPVQYNKVLIDFSQYDSLNAYLSLNNNSITSSTSDTSWIYLIPVTKGERFIAYITPVDGATSTANYTIAGFSENKPAIGSSITKKTLFVVKGQSTTSLRKGTLEIIAPYNGWMAFYFNSTVNTSVLYKMTTDEYNVPVYDTYIEEDIAEKICVSVGGPSGAGNFVKWYNLQQGIDYKVIYAHAVYNTINQTTNSLEFYNDNGDLLGTSGDASETTMVEHRMEDLNTIMQNLNVQGATKLKMNYLVYASAKGGNPLSGCAALMKPLLDDGTMPKNDIVYCVSKIKKPVLPYNFSTEGTTFPQEELWSAWAVRFPSGHTLSGKPTPLCSFFHGSSAYVTSEKISYPTYGATLYKQLNDRGIAVFDINGYGISFLSDNYSRHWGCPAAVETVKAAYNVLTERFNCRKGMVLSGISMGGAIIKSYAMTYPEDCVACAMEAPSEMGMTFRSSTSTGTEVLNAWDLTTRDANAICGYTPFANPYVIDTQNGNVLVHRNITDWTYSDFLKLKSGASSSTPINYEATDLQASAPFPVESVIWHGDADNNVSYAYSVMFERITRNAGSNVKLRLCPNCTHDLDTYPWVCDEVANYIESKLK